jgi:hypothetical protein
VEDAIATISVKLLCTVGLRREGEGSRAEYVQYAAQYVHQYVYK